MRELYQPPGFVAEPESEHLEDESMSESQVQNLIQSSAQNSTPPQHRYHWTSGICACFDDMPICTVPTFVTFPSISTTATCDSAALRDSPSLPSRS